MENLSKKQIITIGVIALIILIVVGYYYITNLQQINYENLEEAETIEENNIETNTIEETSQEIIVHIAGAVRQEGIVTLKEGARIVDAINQAGGLTEKADLTDVNLAYMLLDGQKIYIPNKGEEVQISLENGDEIIVIEAEIEETKNGIVNINTATIAELMELPRNRKLNSKKNNRIQKTKRKIQNNRRYKKRKWNRRIKIQ